MNPGPPSIKSSRSLSAFYRELGAMAGFLKDNNAVPAASGQVLSAMQVGGGQD